MLKSTRQGMRTLASEQVVARVGAALGAPVPEVRVLDLDASLLTTEALRGTQAPGLAHGSLMLSGPVFDWQKIESASRPSQRRCYLLLAVLFCLTHARDMQFVFNATTVYSVDHGAFLPERRTREWQCPEDPLIALPDELADACCFQPWELREGCEALARLRPEHIAAAVGAVPDGWFRGDDPADVACYLARRRDSLLMHLSARIAGGEPS